MTKLAGTFSQFERRKVLVVGDLMLDSYTIGKTRRISPEAPVPVLNVRSEEFRPGGAGNVMLNLLSLGCDVIAIGRVGDDSAGKKLCQVLEDEGVSTTGVVVQKGLPTPVKNRLIADNQQIVRVDREEVLEVPSAVEKQILDALPALMEGVDIVAISDYAKGTLSPAILRGVIDEAKERKVSVIVDPKAVDFSKYNGATVIKPNFSEALRASGLESGASMDDIAKSVMERVVIDYLMVTRSEAGIALFGAKGRQDFPVKAKEVKDVTGAGDTVLATLTCALANNLPMNQAVQLCNFAAGLAIEHFGCARITLPQLARRLLEDNIKNKVFGEEHLFALEEALKGKNFSLVVTETEETFDLSLFETLQTLSRKGEDIVVYIADTDPNSKVVDLLASLEQVAFIILKSQSLESLCQRLQPNEVVDLRVVSLL